MSDINAWTVSIKKGSQALYFSALNGKGAMPAKGGQAQLSDAQIKAAVDYIISNSTQL